MPSLYLFRYRQRSDGYGMDFHAHENLEIFQVNEGEGNVFIRDRVYSFKAGDCFWINALDLHKVYVPPGCSYVRTAITIHPDWHAAWLNLYPSAEEIGLFFYRADLSHRIVLDSGRQIQFGRLLEEMEDAQSAASWRGDLERFLLLTRIMMMLDEHFSLSAQIHDQGRLITPQDRFIQQIIGYIELHVAENLHTEQIAAYFHMNKSYLCHLFKKRTGETISRFLMSRRVALVKQLLLQDAESDLTVIASQTGLSDASYLCRVFKRLTGQTPKQYRQVFTENKV